MLYRLIRKARQLQGDPVLRRWLAGRVLGRWPGEPPFAPHRPPYVDGLLPLPAETPSDNFAELPRTPPTGPLVLELAGETVRVEPGAEAGLFARSFEDIESLLSLHRFAWIAENGDPAWVDALWRAWLERFATPSGAPAWYPYTAAERAVNILRFARRHGLPGRRRETISALAGHAPAIARRLEYFGDHHTSNHLANNGRGLFILGLELGLPRAAELGGRILLQEAERIFSPSGLLREGSSHYHLLCLRLYETAAAAAEKAARPEAAALRAIANTARRAARMLMLPGGLPLIGDISPDISPAALVAALDLEPGPESFGADGWLRFDDGPWSGLWHAAPDGLSQMPGHGHQDTGGFELHYRGEPVFIDPGRGSYGERGEAALYRSTMMHNALMLDGADAFPPNRPYYDRDFRRLIAGPPPELSLADGGVTLRHHGFARLPQGGMHERRWRFDGRRMTLRDSLQGRGRATVSRTLITPLTPERGDGGIVIRGDDATYVLSHDTPGAEVAIGPVIRWRAYGSGTAAYAIRLTVRADLPFTGSMTLEASADGE